MRIEGDKKKCRIRVLEINIQHTIWTHMDIIPRVDILIIKKLISLLSDYKSQTA